MKQLIILLLLIIALLIGYGKYAQYKRYNSPNVDYTTDAKIDLEYYNQELLFNYNKAIEDLNSYVMMQWTANNIDVRTPEDDDEITKLSVSNYSKKLASIKFYENKLHRFFLLKEKGLSNKEIKYLEETGSDLKSYKKSLNNKRIKDMFNADTKMFYGLKSALIFEVQKQLVANGLAIKIDGIFKEETLNAIKAFEKNNKLFPDGYLDVLTLDKLFK